MSLCLHLAWILVVATGDGARSLRVQYSHNKWTYRRKSSPNEANNLFKSLWWICDTCLSLPGKDGPKYRSRCLRLCGSCRSCTSTESRATGSLKHDFFMLLMPSPSLNTLGVITVSAMLSIQCQCNRDASSGQIDVNPRLIQCLYPIEKFVEPVWSLSWVNEVEPLRQSHERTRRTEIGI